VGILTDFERRLEGAIEGIFTKAFRSGVQPVELATRLLKEMEGNRTVGVREVWVPNQFVFRLSPVDRERFQGTERSLRHELEQVVRDGAAERGWGLVGPAKVEFETDDELREGRFTCEPSLVEGPSGPRPTAAAGPPETKDAPHGGGAPAPELEREPEPEPSPKPAELVLIENGAPGRVFPLEKDRLTIGRLPGSDVTLADPGASRRHAEIRLEDGRFVLADLGSTNGTRVNEATVSERPLEDGDRITIGRTVLEFRRR
jgi:hypothetical protein